MRKRIKKLLCTISPVMTTKLMYYYNFNERLDLKNPKGINQKLQYLKLKTYYNNPMITTCVDKYRVKKYLSEKGYENIVCKSLNDGYDNPEDLKKDWDSLPNKMVIKCNHGCNYNILIDDKSKFDVNEIVCQLKKWMKEDFWKVYCEPQYKFVKKHILIEEYLGDDIETYKFYCFNGQPEVFYISSNGENGEKDVYLDYYDMNCNWLNITLYPHLHSKNKECNPKKFKEMVRIATDLSKNFPFVRIDLYNVDGKIYFSEFTFVPTGGIMKLKPTSTIEEWGSWLDISK